MLLLCYSSLSSAPITRLCIKASWKWVKVSLQVTCELLFSELKHLAFILSHFGTYCKQTADHLFYNFFYRSMRVTIFNICAILSLFSVAINATPIIECPIHPIIGGGPGPVCSPRPTPTPLPYTTNWCWEAWFMIEGYGDQNLYIYICAARCWLNYFWRNLNNLIVQMSKGVNTVFLFVRKLIFSCFFKYTVSIFEDRSEIGNTIYRAVVLPVLKEQGYSLQIPVHGAP